MATDIVVPGTDEWLALHGIDPDLWDLRGVERYAKGVSTVASRFWRWPSTQRFIQKIVDQTPGLYMPKHAPEGYPLIPAQLRPDVGVFTGSGPQWHYHPDIPEWPQLPNGEWPCTPPTKPRPATKKHPNGLPPKWPDGRPLRYRGTPGFPQEIHRPLNVYRHINKAVKDGGHGGVNPDEVHVHPERPVKYVFPKKPINVSRIDLHPYAESQLRTAQRIFLVLEGVLKNDAILSAGECAINVPSVTLWNQSELRRFVRDFIKKDVMLVVVPDADWVDNEQVYTQALYVREILRSEWRNAVIASSPVAFFQEMAERGDDTLKGVDDWLGTAGREWAAETGKQAGIEGLVPQGREAPEAIDHWPGSDGSHNVRFNEQRWLRQLSLHAGVYPHEANGNFQRHVQAMASVLGVKVVDVEDRLRRLRGAFDVLDGSLSVVREEIRVRVSPSVYNDVVLWKWLAMPTIQLKPEYRAIESESTILKEIL